MFATVCPKGMPSAYHKKINHFIAIKIQIVYFNLPYKIINRK